MEEVPVVAWPALLREPPAPHGPHRPPRPTWPVLATVLTGLFASGFTITIVAVSLRRVADDVGGDPATLTWIVTGPLLVLALAMPLFGKLGDTFGHRRVYLLGFAGLTVGAAATALAWNAASLIAIRALAALAGAATGPSSMAILMRTFPDEDRVKAMGWWSLVGAGAPVIGLVAGGPLVAAFGWRWIFLAQVPLCALASTAAALVLAETPRRSREPLDMAGAGTLAVACVTALAGLTLGGRRGWGDPLTLVLLGVSPLAAAAFVSAERRASHPLLPLRFFGERAFTASLVAQFAANFAYMGGFILTPLLVQERFGYSVAAASAAMVFRPAAFSLTAPVAGHLAARVGERRAARVGAALLACSMAAFVGAALGDRVPLVYVGLVASGVALGAASPALLTVAASPFPPQDLGVVNGAQGMVGQIGVVAGIQCLASVQGLVGGAGGYGWAYGLGAVVAVVAAVATAALPRAVEASAPVAQAA